MGKIYEALQIAKQDSDDLDWIENVPPSPTEDAPPVINKNHQSYIEPSLSDFWQLKATVMSRLSIMPAIKTIMVAGIGTGDGASTIAANFARVLSQDTKLRILLIDANLRSPQLHRQFTVEHSFSLADLMTNPMNGQQHLLPPVDADTDNLQVIPSGRFSANPIDLFQSMQFQKLLQEMRNQFDYIVIDASPLGLFSESMFLSSKVDAVMLVAEAGKTPRWAMQKVKQQIEAVGTKILGVVLNKRRYYIPDWIYKRL